MSTEVTMQGNNEALSVCIRFNAKLELFMGQIMQVVKQEGIPLWCTEILLSLEIQPLLL